MNADAYSASLGWLRARLEGAKDPAPPPPPALSDLTDRFGLSAFEQQVLLLCTAPELDPELASAYSRSRGVPYPTFALAFRLFDAPEWAAMSPHRPLRFWRLLEINQPGALPLTAAALRTDERITAFLAGVNEIDDRLQPLLSPMTEPPGTLSESQLSAVGRLVDHWRDRADVAVQLIGADPETLQAAAWNAAQALERQLHVARASWLPSDGGELTQIARLLAREYRLFPIALYVDAHDDSLATPDQARAIERLFGRRLGHVAIAMRDARASLGPAIEVDRPSRHEQYQAWARSLGEGREPAAQRLAAQFNLTLPSITTLAVENATDASTWAAALEHTRPKLDQLATRIDARACWRDLVLPATERKLLYSIVRQASQRHVVYDEWGFRRKTSRGLGIAALFAGDSGTGKTLAAEVLANHLRLNLYRIDLSAVVSKYIGETEKNLRRVFDAAEDGGAILFFDEADALFGKRTEIRDSHDRYANIEINYLLQRIESFNGLTILSTNMKSAIDPAFLRRLRVVVNFPFPDAAARRRIWAKAIPSDTPVERDHPRLRLDLAALSRLNLTGGSIHNIALNSAFAAATRGRRVTWPLVLDAVRTELRKLDRPVSELDRGLAVRREAMRA